MGLALTLLVANGWSETNGKIFGFAHTLLEMRMGSVLDDGILADDIRALRSTELPKDADFTSYVATDPKTKDNAYGRLKTTPYGKRYTWVYAEDLAPVLQKHQPDEPATAYVAKLHKHTRIILHWH